MSGAAVDEELLYNVKRCHPVVCDCRDWRLAVLATHHDFRNALRAVKDTSPCNQKHYKQNQKGKKGSV